MNVKLFILKKEKKLKIKLEEFQLSKEQIIAQLTELKKKNSSIIAELNEQYVKITKECETLLEKKK